MTLGLDPEIRAALGALPLPDPDSDPGHADALAIRATLEPLYWSMLTCTPVPAEIEVSAHAATSADGTPVPLRLYRRAGIPATGLIVYLHGGGMIAGNLEIFDPLLRRYAHAGGVPMLAVGYRLAPEHPYPAGVEDAYAAIVWAGKHAGELGADPARIAVAGAGGGAGIAAGAVLLGRDRGGPTLAGQALIQPMLDDRTVTADPLLGRETIWTHQDNRTAWAAVLARPIEDAPGHTPPYAAPARSGDVAGLPPTYLEIAGLDVVRDEGLAFGARLARVGTPVEMHLHPGVPHAFDVLAPDATVTARATDDRLRFFQAMVGHTSLGSAARAREGNPRNTSGQY